MRQFASSGFRLWNLSLEARVLYTAFCLLTFAGLVSSVLYYVDLVGGSTGIEGYYAGEGTGAANQGSDSQSPAGGPNIDLPVSDGAPIVVAVTYRKLLEVTHFHLFTMPVVLLIVGHLFFGTGLSTPSKLIWVAAASASTMLHLATPWIVRYGGGSFSLLHAISGAGLGITMSVLTIYPCYSMWQTPPTRGGAAGRPEDAGAPT